MSVNKATARELTTTEAAREAGIRLDVLYPMLRAGRLEARKVDGRWLISAEAVRKRQKRLGTKGRSVAPGSLGPGEGCRASNT